MTTDSHDQEAAIDEAAMPGSGRRRLAYFLMAVLAVLLLAFIPPLVNVGSFQRRMDANISAALGRPVHFDRLSLNLLPMPGFTLENFVIEEDPAFGYEPTLHADEVRINVRLSSLWRRRIELSSISFTDPSVNLVHTSDGRWNLQALLLQASRIPAEPTAQTHAGPAPRFPYIEATNARVNLKLDQEKTPVSLTEADFALWQPEERRWQLRIQARPQRTDITPGESGKLRVEGTLGGDGDHATLAGMPIDLHATLQEAQLGGLTSLLRGHDAGLRGNFAVDLEMLGTIGRNTITATLNLDDARRADFIPPHPLVVSVRCRATAENSFHAFPSIECRLPPSDTSAPAMLALAAAVPDVKRPELSTIRIDVPALPSQMFYAWLGVATPHPPTAFAGRGMLTGALEWGTGMQPTADQRAQPSMTSGWTGELKLSGEWLKLPSLGDDGAPLEDVVLRSAPTDVPPGRSKQTRDAQTQVASTRDSFDLQPVSLPLGGARSATLSGSVDDSGYSLHLTGPVDPDQLIALGDAIPQFGDGLKKLLKPDDSPTADPIGPTDKTDQPQTRGHGVAEPAKPAPAAPVSVDISASRAWGGAQMWSQTVPLPAAPHQHRSYANLFAGNR